MKLNEANYYGPEANEAYFSVSQYKDFLKCPAMAMAKIRGEFTPEYGRALLLGSLFDEMLTGTVLSLQAFVEEHHGELYKKNGDPYADVEQVFETVDLVRKQPLMMKYLSGQHQVIMTGEIEGVPFKIKMDSYEPDEYITDLKYMASLRSPNLFEPMIKYWGYDSQAAVYQEIVRQNTGKKLPFIFDVATKEKPAHLAVGEINQWNMDTALDAVKKNIRRFQKIKKGEITPERCEDYSCEYCTRTRVLTVPIDTDLFGMSAAQIKGMDGVI